MPAGSSSSGQAAGRSWRAWLGGLPGRLRCHWRLKALLALALSLLFCGPYFLIGHFPVFPVRVLPLTWVDRAAGFHPYEWVWVYQSVYVPVNVIPWLARRREELARYARGFAVLSAVSFVVFFFYPVRAPKPPVADATGMYWLLLQYDAPQNAFPSLHAGLLVFTLCFGRRIFRGQLPPGLGVVCLAWAGLILCGTLTTKEHYFVDIVAGAALGLLAHAWAWRGAAQASEVAAPPPRPGAAAAPERRPPAGPAPLHAGS
jgi:membrane-associated phospholipid phosphatase